MVEGQQGSTSSPHPGSQPGVFSSEAHGPELSLKSCYFTRHCLRKCPECVETLSNQVPGAPYAWPYWGGPVLTWFMATHQPLTIWVMDLSCWYNSTTQEVTETPADATNTHGSCESMMDIAQRRPAATKADTALSQHPETQCHHLITTVSLANTLPGAYSFP